MLTPIFDTLWYYFGRLLLVVLVASTLTYPFVMVWNCSLGGLIPGLREMTFLQAFSFLLVVASVTLVSLITVKLATAKWP